MRSVWENMYSPAAIPHLAPTSTRKLTFVRRTAAHGRRRCFSWLLLGKYAAVPQAGASRPDPRFDFCVTCEGLADKCVHVEQEQQRCTTDVPAVFLG